MLVHFLHIERWPCETTEAFCRRRYRAAANLARQQGDWNTEHARRVCSWAEHLERPRNQASLAALFFAWHDASWLEGRRSDPFVGGPLRPGTRTSSGFLCARWDESIQKARDAL